MANTRYLTTVVEDYVRGRLREIHGVTFDKQFLKLTTGSTHEFDAVALDRSIVASIKATSGLTAGGRIPVGKLHNAISELYYLSLVHAPKRMLVLTYPPFHEMLTRKMDGALTAGVTIECVPLPEEMQREVDAVMRAASREVTPVGIEAAAEAEVTEAS